MKKLLTTALSLGLMAMMAVPCFAEEGINVATSSPTDNIEVNTNGVGNTDVIARIESQYSVLIPKQIDVSSLRSNYTVKVKGDLRSNENLEVIPTETVTLADQHTSIVNKDDVIAQVTQAKNAWDHTEIQLSDYSSTTGEIVAEGLTAGFWKGILSFTIQVVTLEI